MLTITYTFTLIGIFPGLILYCICSAVCYFTLDILTVVSHESQIMNLFELIDCHFGWKLTLVSNIAQLFNILGLIVAYIQISKTIIITL